MSFDAGGGAAPVGFTQILDFSVVNFKGVLLSPGRRAARMMPGGNDGASDVPPPPLQGRTEPGGQGQVPAAAPGRRVYQWTEGGRGTSRVTPRLPVTHFANGMPLWTQGNLRAGWACTGGGWPAYLLCGI